jgi:ankyrin repeat protein
MTTRMTAQRLARLIEAGDVDAVRTAVTESPHLLTHTVERGGQGGWTALHLAVAEGRADIVRLLVEAGADLDSRTEHRRTPLHVALQYRPSMVGLLEELGAVMDAPSAAYLDDVDQLRRQLDGGAELSDPDTGDLLTWAAYGGAAGTTRLLLDHGADPDRGALHAAAERGRLDVVRMLLDAGADIDRLDPATGRAPLHAAVTAGAAGEASEVVRVLLAAGADVNATTHDGASALDISRVAAARSRRDDADRATGNDALAELLVAHGASN